MYILKRYANGIRKLRLPIETKQCDYRTTDHRRII
nr:MAG TPA: hypothetical protein [Bacteriophage sp.]